MASDGSDTVKHVAHYLSCYRQPGYRFFFFGVFVFGGRSQLMVKLIISAGRGTFTPHMGNDRTTYPVVLMVRRPRGSSVLLTSLFLEVATPEIKLLNH